MNFKLGQRSLKNLQGVHPDLVRVVHATILETPVDFTVIEGVRTLERQKKLVASGASQTLASRHLGGFAVDLAAYVGGRIDWSLGLYYQIAATVQNVSKALAVPIRWGGCWLRLDTTDKSPDELVAEYVASRRAAGKKAFIDAPHFELPEAIYK